MKLDTKAGQIFLNVRPHKRQKLAKDLLTKNEGIKHD